MKEAAAKKAVKVVGDENVPLNIQEGAKLEDAQAERQRLPQAAAARRAVVIQKKAVAAQPNRAPLTQQLTQQARPLLRGELIFARSVCHLNRDELRKLNEEMQKALDEIVAKLVDAQFQPRGNRAVRVAGAGGNVAVQRASPSLDAHQLLDDGVVAVMKKTLAPSNGPCIRPRSRSAGRVANMRPSATLSIRSTASYT